MVSTVNSYGPPVTTACSPRISPASAIRTINVLPSREVVESLARPWQRMKIPQGLCPSTRTTACSGKTAARFILSKAAIDSGDRSQKKIAGTQMTGKTAFNTLQAGHGHWRFSISSQIVCAGLESNDGTRLVFEARGWPDRRLRKVTIQHCTPTATSARSILGLKVNACSIRHARGCQALAAALARPPTVGRDWRRGT